MKFYENLDHTIASNMSFTEQGEDVLYVVFFYHDSCSQMRFILLQLL